MAKAYFIGLMISDGNVQLNGNVSFVSMDRVLVAWIRDFMAPSSPVRDSERTRKGLTVYRWSVWSMDLVATLMRLGINPRKSLTVGLPDIPDGFLWDFLRGLLDGDGTVDKARRVAFSTGSSRFATDLLHLLDGIGLTAKSYGARSGFVLTVNVGSSRLLGSRMYRPGVPCLERKRLRLMGPRS